MTANELRQKYLRFFKEKGHAIIPGASLIPEYDPTVLFTTAGMHPLIPFLMGEKHPAGKRLANYQRCIRTTDIDEVGDDWHLTFFEMLGNWSLGGPDAANGIGAGYFKKEAIEMSWEFLTDRKWLGLDPKRIAVSVFTGDEDAPFDEEAYKIWRSIGIPEKRIAKLGKRDNWWGPAGETGPCGPDTEMFYWSGVEQAPEKFDPEDKKWVEIWNNVFMEYERVKILQMDMRINTNNNANKRYKFVPLKQKNIDTGMGLERTIAALNGLQDVYEIELLKPIVEKILEIAGVPDSQHEEFYQSNKRSIRIIADHIRAATFILGDPNGVIPSNLGRGYVLRRLIRRTIRFSKIIGINIKKDITTPLTKTTIELFKAIYPELEQNQDKILSELKLEKERFEKTLEKGLKKFNEMVRDNKISGAEAFILFSTYGFPLEVTRELAMEKGIKVDEKQFQEEFKKHQELSRTASVGMFKGGLADASQETKKLHTATHLLHAALRQVIGKHVLQKGSNITPERLRFDFSHPQKLSEEGIKRLNDLVNEKIHAGLPVYFEEMDIGEAKRLGAVSVFEQKYGEKVKVYFIGEPKNYFSIEICGGPHVENTKELGEFKIIKEEAVSAGVRRIKAILR